MILAFRGQFREGDIHLGVTGVMKIIETLGMYKITRNSIDKEVREISKTFWETVNGYLCQQQQIDAGTNKIQE